MNGKVGSKYIDVLAFACSTILLALVMVVLLRWQIPRAHGLLLPLAACLLLGGAFGFFRHVNPWALGLWASSAFWIYFAVVFLSLALHRETEWLPFFEGAAAIGSGVFGALATRRLAWVVRRGAT